MTEPILFGLDPGNSEASGTLALNGKERILTNPSKIGDGSLRELTHIRGGANVQHTLQAGECVLWSARTVARSRFG
jgi:hypothetical protein